ncbi:DUF4421 family protein [Sunxiuqinia sp. A32]|uniref:DUF4421 family protein n=1 Tax=Sunxiuqinia sp. A32 TaxID=3461496 RepID=UPI00404563CD
MRKIYLIGILCLFQCSIFAQIQNIEVNNKLDSNYIQSFYNDLIVRVYSSNKNNFIQFKDVANSFPLKYRPNDFYTIGLGFNYKWFGLNIGAKIPFLSNDDSKYGETTSLGLQSYIYARKFTLDILALHTKGYYLNLKRIGDFINYNESNYYWRRDMLTRNYGANFNYVFNNSRFSYKAAFKQNELQKKSAGSVIAGVGLFLLNVDADSAFVPREIDEKYFANWRALKTFQSYSLSANVGYAYSLVPAPNWIFTGSCKLGVVVQQSRWNSLGADTWKSKIGSSSEIRFSGGRHFNEFYLGASFVSYQQASTMEHRMLNIKNGTNFIEFSISKRIKL